MIHFLRATVSVISGIYKYAHMHIHTFAYKYTHAHTREHTKAVGRADREWEQVRYGMVNRTELAHTLTKAHERKRIDTTRFDLPLEDILL
jgi:hypothetical protein